MKTKKIAVEKDQETSIKILLEQHKWDIQETPIEDFCQLINDTITSYQDAYGVYMYTLSHDEFHAELDKLNDQEYEMAAGGMEHMIQQVNWARSLINPQTRLIEPDMRNPN